MKTMTRAPADVKRRVNGRPPDTQNFLFSGNVNDLRRFATAQSFGRRHFASLPIEKPEGGRALNPNPCQIRQEGIVSLMPRTDSLSMELYKKMRKDPQIALGLAAIKAPIMGAFESIRVDCRDPVIRGFVQQVLMNESGGILRQAVYSALKSLDFGFAVHEKVWENGVTVEFQMEIEGEGEPKVKKIRNSTILKEVCDLDPEYIEVLVDGKTGDYEGVRYGMDDTQVLESSKTWLVTHEKEFGDLLGNASQDRVYNPWYWCDIMYLFCNRYYERKASPPIKGRAPSIISDDEGNTVTGVELFTSMLDSLVSDGICVLPSEVQREGGRFGTPIWDVEYLLDDKRGEMFIRYLEHLQTLKLRGLWLPEMVVERGAPAGTYGMARAHTEFFIEMLTLVLEEVLWHVNRYLIPEIVQHNFGSNAPPCSVDTLTKIGERRDLLEQLLVEVIRAESRAGSVDTARIVDIIALLRQLNIGVQPRRKMPDYEEQVAQERAALQIQTKAVEGNGGGSTGAGAAHEIPAATPKITPPPRKQIPDTPGLKPTPAQASLEDRLDDAERVILDLRQQLSKSGRD